MRAASFTTEDFFGTMIFLSRFFKSTSRRRARLIQVTLDTADGERHRCLLHFKGSEEFCGELREELRRLGSRVSFHNPRKDPTPNGLLLEYWRCTEDRLWYWQLTSDGVTWAYGTPQRNLQQCIRAIVALSQREIPLPLRNLTPWAT